MNFKLFNALAVSYVLLLLNLVPVYASVDVVKRNAERMLKKTKVEDSKLFPISFIFIFRKKKTREKFRL